MPPTLHVAGPQTVAAGQTFALDNLVSLSDPDAQPDAPNPFTTAYIYTVDWGDGSQPFNGSNVQVISPGGNGLPFLGELSSAPGDGPLTHVYTDPGTFNLTVTVTQISSGLSDTQTIPITVEAQTPTITVGGYPITKGKICNEGTAPITWHNGQPNSDRFDRLQLADRRFRGRYGFSKHGSKPKLHFFQSRHLPCR